MNILPDGISVITPKYLPAHIREPVRAPEELQPDMDSFDSAVRAFERRKICDALKKNGGKIAAAARLLQMSRQNLQYYIKRHQIDVTEFQ